MAMLVITRGYITIAQFLVPKIAPKVVWPRKKPLCAAAQDDLGCSSVVTQVRLIFQVPDEVKQEYTTYISEYF